MKGFVYSVLDKPIKAANMFDKADETIRMICSTQLRIATKKKNPELRPDTFHYPVEIL